MRSQITIFITCLLCLLSIIESTGQSMTINKVNLSGLKKYKETYLRNFIPITKGHPLTHAELEDVRQQLMLRTGVGYVTS